MWFATTPSARVLGALLLVSLLPNGAASAKRDAEPAPGFTAEVTPGDSNADDSLESRFEGPAQILSPTEMTSLSKKHAVELSNILLNGEHVREEAARQRDLIRLSCVQDHLTQMQMTKRLADDAYAALKRPDIRQDELRQRHEFRSLEMGLERMNELLTEMNDCVGAEIALTGDLASASENPRGDSSDPTSVHVGTPTIERPVAASPFY